MHRHSRMQRLSQAAGLAALAVCAAPAASGDTLVVNGKTTSADVRSIGGSAYVKFSDVAKALGMVLVKRPGGYELTKAGGTNQVQAVTQGKVGDVLFDGWWRFQVQNVEMTDSYAVKKNGDGLSFDRSTNVVHAKPRTKLVVIR